MHGATRLEVLDELVNVNERHWDALLDTVDALDVRFDVPNGMRADYLEPRHLTRMKGRVTTVSVSAESGVQRVVTEVVNKRLDLRAIVAAAEAAHAAGVPLMVHYIIGMPGETADEIRATLAFALDLYARFRAWPAVQFATPLPGTGLARGRALPVVDDWGPRFQQSPSQPGAAVSAEDLQKLHTAFLRDHAALQQPPRALPGTVRAHRATLQLLSACNNACVFCAQAGAPALAPAGAEDLERTLAALRATADEVTFLGGEPTLHPDLPGAVATARRVGFRRVGIQTNGRRLAQPGYVSALSSAGLTDVHLSLHGASPALHDHITGMEGSFAQALAGLTATRQARLTTVVTTVLTRSNFRSLTELPRMLSTLGTAGWQVAVPRAAGRAAAGFDQEIPRLALAMPFVLHLVESARALGLPAWVRGAPLCLLGPLTDRAAPDTARTYGAACEGCGAQPGCAGVDPAYLVRFGGDELTARAAPPVKAEGRAEVSALLRMFVGEGELVPGDLPAHARPTQARTRLSVVTAR